MMAGQVVEPQQVHQQQAAASSMLLGLGQLQANFFKSDHHHHLVMTTTATTTPATSAAAGTTTPAAAEEMAYLQLLQRTAAAAAEANNNSGGGNSGHGGARGEQCPRCASHDTKFCYYNNYNTSQPRHFCRACRRYWTLGGSLRNVPIGGSTRKRPRLAHSHMPRRHPVFGGGACSAPPAAATTVPTTTPAQGLLGSLFALGTAAPLLEGRGGDAGFDLGLGLPMPGGAAGGFAASASEVGAQMQGLGLIRGGHGGTSSAFLWPAAGLLDGDSVDGWKVSGVGATTAMWPEFSAASAAPPPQVAGLLHGEVQLM